MAIVQISKIQVRRGVKGESDVPALEPGEFGWAIDTHELFIGNDRQYDYFYDQQVYDSTGYEPFVPGSMYNTRILTTNDFNKITELAKYRYSDPANHFVITLQEKLEQVVYVEDFGASVDLGDNAVEFQKAVNRVGTKRVLHLQPGTYKINSSISIPPDVMIHGAGIEETVIELGNDGFIINDRVSLKDVTIRSTNDEFPVLTVNGNNVVLQCNVEYTDFGNVGVGIVLAVDTVNFKGGMKNCNVGFSAQTINESMIDVKCVNVNTAISANIVASSTIVANGAPVNINTILNSQIRVNGYSNSGTVLPGGGTMNYRNATETGTISFVNGVIAFHEALTSNPESDIAINSPNWQTVSGQPINYSLTVNA